MGKTEMEGFLEVVLDAVRKVLNTHDFFKKSGILSVSIDEDYLNIMSFDHFDKEKIVDVTRFYKKGDNDETADTV